MSSPDGTRRRSLPLRFGQYLLERFPPLGHGLLVVVFTFSAVAYSILLRGRGDFIPVGQFALAAFLTVTLFLLLRISDEFKDAVEDAAHRPELPVPRGLISLRELAGIGAVIVVAQVALLLVFAKAILPLYALALGYMAAMFVEFGVHDWLRRHPWAYNASHMLIIPLVDVVASGFDWRLAGADPPPGLAWFFAVSYCNGVVLELGRKLAPPGAPDPGRRFYTTQLGRGGAVVALASALVVTFGLAWGALSAAGHATGAYVGISVVLLLCAAAVAAFYARPTAERAKVVELASGVWALGMYLFLGGLPMAAKLLGL